MAIDQINNRMSGRCDAHRLKDLAMEKTLTLAVAESLTSGNIQAEIGSVSGASNFFEGGLTVYNIDQKVALLGVNKSHAELVNCVSDQVAREMAEGVCKRFRSDVGLATTGYAEPFPSAEFSIPYAYYAVWHQSKDKGLVVREGLIKQPNAKRLEMQQQVTNLALQALVEYLESL